MSGPTTLDIVTLVVAIFGALMGLAALVWQIAQHSLTGARVRVELKSAMLGPGGAVVAPQDQAWRQADQIRPNGYSTPAYAVTVINRGRFPATVESVSFVVGGGLGYRPVADLIGPELPHRIEGGSAGTWYVNARAVWATEDASATVLNTPRSGVKAEIGLADGKSRESARIPVLAFEG